MGQWGRSRCPRHHPVLLGRGISRPRDDTCCGRPNRNSGKSIIVYLTQSLTCLSHQCYQRIYEWRGHFGAAALVAIDELFQTTITLPNGKSKLIYGAANSRRDYVSRELGIGLPFLYSSTDYDNEGQPVSLFFIRYHTLTNNIPNT